MIGLPLHRLIIYIYTSKWIWYCILPIITFGNGHMIWKMFDFVFWCVLKLGREN